MKLEKRSSFGWPATKAGTAPCKNGLVAHYDSNDQGLAGKSHEACRSYWKRTRVFHMTDPKHRWLDIGYSFMVCPHGVVMEGRGFGRVQAAQPGGNTTWTSVTFGSGPSEKPTDAQLKAWGELRAWLRGKALASAVRGHRDFIATSCPGSILYAKVKDGSLRIGAPSTPASTGSTRVWPGTYYQLKTPMMRGEPIKWIQQRLNAKGASPKLGVDGVFGSKTDREVRDFQKGHKLDVDGIVGKLTWTSLAK